MNELEENLESIYQEKINKIIPENIKKGVNIFDVTGEAVVWEKESPKIYQNSCLGGDSAISIENSVNAIVGNYIYAVIDSRDTITVSDGWTLLAENSSTRSDLTFTQYLKIYHKKAVSEIEQITVTQSSNARLHCYMFSFEGNAKIPEVVFNSSYNDSVPNYIINNIKENDMLITDCIFTANADVNATINIDADSTKYNNIKTKARLAVFVMKEDKEKVTVTFETPNPYSGIVLRFEKETTLLPENIKEDINILGVIGTLKPGLDTSDATATAGDIVQGQTAYVNGEKITGTIEKAKSVEQGITTMGTQFGTNYNFNTDIPKNRILYDINNYTFFNIRRKNSRNNRFEIIANS